MKIDFPSRMVYWKYCEALNVLYREHFPNNVSIKLFNFNFDCIVIAAFLQIIQQILMFFLIIHRCDDVPNANTKIPSHNFLLLSVFSDFKLKFFDLSTKLLFCELLQNVWHFHLRWRPKVTLK